MDQWVADVEVIEKRGSYYVFYIDRSLLLLLLLRISSPLPLLLTLAILHVL